MTAYASALTANDFHADTQAFFRNKRVLVTGGDGFIGSHCVEQLQALGAQVNVPSRKTTPRFLNDRVQFITGDLSDPALCQRCMTDIDCVIHMAADVGGIEYNKTHPASIFQCNLQVFMHVISAAEAAKVARFCTVSSACVYPRHCSIPTPEEEGTLDEPEPTNAGYGYAKRMEEFLSQKYAEEFGLSVAIPRPYNAYGPRDNFDPKQSHVIPALIHKAFTCEDDTFEVWGSGDHSRSFLYVDDFARGVIEVAARYAEADPVNIGAQEETTITALASTIAQLVSEKRGKTVTPHFNTQGITGQPRRCCDTQKLQQTLNFNTRVSLETGLNNTVEWYLENRACFTDL